MPNGSQKSSLGSLDTEDWTRCNIICSCLYIPTDSDTKFFKQAWPHLKESKGLLEGPSDTNPRKILGSRVSAIHQPTFSHIVFLSETQAPLPLFLIQISSLRRINNVFTSVQGIDIISRYTNNRVLLWFRQPSAAAVQSSEGQSVPSRR